MKNTLPLHSSLNIAALAAAVFLAFSSSAQANSSTWGVTATGTHAWATSTDWAGNVIPGATGGSTTNGDTATFNATSGAQTVTVDTGRNIQNMSFVPNSGFGGAYTFSGGSLILTSGGSITVASGAGEALISTPMTLEGNYTFSGAGSVSGNILNISGPISAANTGTTLTLTGLANVANNVISSVLSDGSGQLSLDKEGPAGWLVEGSNTYTGATTINGGTLSLGGGPTAGSFSSSSSVTIGASGTLSLALVSGNLFSNAVTDNGAIISADASTITASGNISGTGTFTMNAGAGTTILTGSNTYTGSTQVTAGTLQIGNGVTGSISSSSVVKLTAGALALDLADGSTFTNNITDTAATVKAIQSGSLTISGFITGTGAFAQAGSGTTILTNTNSYSGGTTVSSGILRLSGSGLLGATTGALTVNGGSLDLNGTSQAVGALSGTGGSITSTGSASALTIGTGTTLGSAPITFAGTIANGISSLTKVGGNQEALTGSNTYTGATQIQGGILDAVDGTGLPTGSLLNISNGIFGSSGTGANSFVRILGTSAGNVELTGGESGFSADLGNLTVALGGTGSPTAITWGQGTFNPSLLVLNGLEATSTLSFENALDLAGQNRTILTATNTANFDGAITSTGGGGLTKIGAGTLVLTSTNNTYTGGTAVDSGVVSVAALSSIGSGSATVYNTGELRLASASNVVSGQKVVVNSGGILGLTSNTFTQANLVSLVDPSSSGILAIDTAGFSNALNLATIGNGGMSLGSSIGTSAATGGVYSAGSLTIAPGGTAPTAVAPLDPAIFGGTYRLGGGGGWLTITGQNVLTDQANAFLATNVNNALATNGRSNNGTGTVAFSATSNTRNSLVVGAPGGNGPGTLDLANNQSFTGVSTVNPGSTLVLDFSDTLATPTLLGTNVNILNPNNEVDLAGGTLSVLGNGSGVSEQDLGSTVFRPGGLDTVIASQSGSHALTVNLGAIGYGTSISGAGTPQNSNGASVLIEQGTVNNATIETSTAPTSGDGVTYGGSVVYESGAGVYNWATGTTNPGSNNNYVIGAYTGDTVNVFTGAGGTSSTKDYFMTASTGVTAPETVNLLHITGGSLAGAVATFTPATPGLTINGGGILVTGTTGAFIGSGGTNNSTGQFLTSGATPTINYATGTPFAVGTGGFNFLNITNDSTGTVGIGGTSNGDGPFLDNGSTKLVVVLSGPGAFNENVTGNLTFAGLTYTGGTILNGVTLTLGGGSSFGNGGVVTINQGTTLKTNGSTTLTGLPQNNTSFALNGNFTLSNVGGTAANTGLQSYSLGGSSTTAGTGVVTLDKDITITLNDGATGTTVGNSWTLGTLQDGGYGYGLTVNFFSGGISTAGEFVLGPTTGGTNTFTGALTLNNTGSTANVLMVLGANALNRNNVFNLGPEITASMSATNLAGLNDAGLGNSTEIIQGGGALTLWGTGNYSFAGNISSTNSINMSGLGKQTLTGSNTTTGALTVAAGTLMIDASKGGSIGATPATAANAVTLAGGTLALKGASTGTTTQNLGAVTANVGGSTIQVDNNGGASGATTLNLGTFSTIGIGATVDVSAINSVALSGTSPTITSTSGNVSNNTFATGGHVVYTDITGNTTWATSTSNMGLGTNTIGAYTADTLNPLQTSGSLSATTNYTLNTTQTQTGSSSIGLLRINNSGAGSLNLGANNLVVADTGLLFTGTAAYTINGTTGSLQGGILDKELIIQNYGTGANTLTINSTIANNGSANLTALTIAGPGNTILNGTNTYGGTTTLNNGKITFSSLKNFGTGSALVFNGATLQYATGNTADLSIGSSGKLTTITASGATIDTNGNNIEYDSNFGTGVGGVTFVDTATTTHGTININLSTGYTGFTTIGAGANVNLGKDGNLTAGSNAQAGTIIASGGRLSGGTTQVTANLQGTSGGAGSNNAGKITLQSGGKLAPGNLGSPTTGGGAFAISGVGLDSGSKGNMNANVSNNVLNAQQLTWNAGGTLQFSLDSTPQEGTALHPSASTLLNLGTGALIKSGTGQFILDFQHTGAYNVSGNSQPDGSGVATDYNNVYDLINFGTTSTYGVLTPNTNFNIDDFTIENLNGVGTLSFYYNPNADGNLGQEELLLTVVPEPSTWAMLIGGLVALVFWTRKRSRRAVSLRKA